MARLKAYTVTSGITPEEIKEEVLKRLKVTEEESKEDTFKNVYWVHGNEA